MNRTYSFAPATDTTELPAVMRGCPPTTELHLLDLRPPVSAPRTSGLVRHLRASARAAFWPLAVGSGVVVGRYLVDVTSTWSQADWVIAVCAAVAAASGIALFQLRSPRSFLSRLVDGPAGDPTNRKALR